MPISSSPITPASDETCSITPPRASRCGKAARAYTNAPRTLTSITRLYASSGVSSTPACTPIPALFTRMSSPPSIATVSSTLARAWSGSAASARTNLIAPREPSSCSASSPSEASRPVITTEAPSSRKRSAIARPSPVVPPVISAALPASSGIDREPFAADRQRHRAPARRPDRLLRDLGAVEREGDETRARARDAHGDASQSLDPLEPVRHLGNEVQPRVLMQAVAKRLLEQRRIVRKGLHEQRRMAEVEDGVGDRNPIGQRIASARGVEANGRHEDDRPEVRMWLEAVDVSLDDDREPAERRGRRVVGMTLDPRRLGEHGVRVALRRVDVAAVEPEVQHPGREHDTRDGCRG